MVAADLVGVRRTEFAEHLPHQVGQFGARAHEREQLRVAIAYERPSRRRTSLVPKLFASASATPRRYICAHSSRGSTSTLARRKSSQPERRPGSSGGWRGSSSPFFGKLAQRVDDAHSPVRTCRQASDGRAPRRISDRLVLRSRRSAAVRSRTPTAFRPRPRLPTSGRRFDALDGESREQHAAARGDDLTVVPFLDREAENRARGFRRSRSRRERLSSLSAFIVVAVAFFVLDGPARAWERTARARRRAA